MFTTLIYLIFAVCILLALVLIYNIYCMFDLIFGKNISKYNIWKIVVKNKKSKTSKLDKVKVIPINISINITLAQVVFCMFMVGLSLFGVSKAIEQAASIVSILGDDSECCCYAKCIDGTDNDGKCSYELIFGPNKYEQFKKTLIKSLNKQDEENFNKLTDGKEISDFLAAHVTEDLVNLYYMHLTESGNNIHKIDGKMNPYSSQADLKADLINLLTDYKVNGRNPNCKCFEKSGLGLSSTCMGVKNWKAGWTWPISENESTSDYVGDTNGFTSYGQATGPYTITLSDGTWYWFHQASGCLTCPQCGDWSRKNWGGNNKDNILAVDGCAVYSLAIAVSNQLGRAVTPHELLVNLGCTITDNQIDTSTSPAFDKRAGFSGRGIVASQAIRIISEKYGLETRLISKTTTDIDKELDHGAYVWGQWKNGPNGWYSGSGHYMVVRKYLGEQYFRFDPVLSYSMENGASKNSVVSSISSSYLYSIYNPNKSTSDSEFKEINKDVYDKLKNDSRYAGKASVMALAYAYAQPKYGENFAIGLMANILAEGDAGKIEGINYKSAFSNGVISTSRKRVLSCGCSKSGTETIEYWADSNVPCDAHELASKTITNANMVDIMLKIPGSVPGIGVGSVQWSGNRRVNLLNKYKSSAKTYSSDELMGIELEFSMEEFSGGYSSVVNHCSGKSAYDCGYIICNEYESPGSSAEAAKRANSAQEIYNLLHS